MKRARAITPTAGLPRCGLGHKPIHYWSEHCQWHCIHGEGGCYAVYSRFLWLARLRWRLSVAFVGNVGSP